jgi:large subunit ribosomal protein L9
MKPVTLLLTDTIENLGIVGDVVTVKAGFARNYLIPMGLGTEPTEENVAALAQRRIEVEKEMKALRKQREAMFAKLETTELTMERSANDQGVLYGSVNQHEIAEALRAEGFAIEDRAVRIGEQIKRHDTYIIPISLDQDLKTEIKLWVVSDRPADELGDESEESSDGDEGAAETGEAEATDAGADAAGE